MITALAAVLAMTAGLLTYLSLDQRSEAAASLPDGFLIEESPSGQEAQLTDFAYTPDGGYFTTSKTGHIAWVSAAGQVVPQADVDVESIQDLGLTGIAVAPDFATSRTVYTARTTSLGKLRLSAWQAQGTGTPAGLTGERVVMEADRRSDVHAITGVLAEADGTLWVTIGDSADFRFTDPAAFDVQNPDTPYGKIFHINPDGTGVAGNPAYDGADPASWRSRMYANGFRSPFRMSIDPGTGAPIMGDVGWMTWEEVNFVQPGNNYGWPCWEGDAPTAGYTDRDECAGSTAAGPLYTYRHAANSGASVTGGIVYTGLNYPKQYRGLYFFGDYSRTSIETLRLRDDAGQPVADPTAEGFGLNIGGPVRFGAAENGDIVFADIYDSTLKRIVYKPGNRPPVAKATSVVDPATRTVSFDATASSDLDGDPLTYTWDFGDGEKGQGAQTTHVYPDSPHDFTATVTVADDKGGSGTYALKVVPSNNAPKIEWTAPPEDTVFKVGDPVRIDATAGDGALRRHRLPRPSQRAGPRRPVRPAVRRPRRRHLPAADRDGDRRRRGHHAARLHSPAQARHDDGAVQHPRQRHHQRPGRAHHHGHLGGEDVPRGTRGGHRRRGHLQGVGAGRRPDVHDD
ncbi:MAG: PKD domain-containing protein, partial [Streptomycetaceae bacterium]|nr:PKD domain-containing protein [Streptomycetaceae bacterium]